MFTVGTFANLSVFRASVFAFTAASSVAALLERRVLTAASTRPSSVLSSERTAEATVAALGAVAPEIGASMRASSVLSSVRTALAFCAAVGGVVGAV